MTNFLDKIFGKKEPEQIKKTEDHKIPVSMYDFVEQYTFINPRNVFMDYELFSLCKFVPVAYESGDKSSGFATCVQLETKYFLPFLRALKNAPVEISGKKEMRTVSIVNLKYGEKAYIFPSLNGKNEVVIRFSHHDNEKHAKLPVSCFVSPVINRAIVAQAKVY